MSEENIKKGNIKLMVFDEFDFDELTSIVEAIKRKGYSASIVSNGNIVFQKLELEHGKGTLH